MERLTYHSTPVMKYVYFKVKTNKSSIISKVTEMTDWWVQASVWFYADKRTFSKVTLLIQLVPATSLPKTVQCVIMSMW